MNATVEGLIKGFEERAKYAQTRYRAAIERGNEDIASYFEGKAVAFGMAADALRVHMGGAE